MNASTKRPVALSHTPCQERSIGFLQSAPGLFDEPTPLHLQDVRRSEEFPFNFCIVPGLKHLAQSFSCLPKSCPFEAVPVGVKLHPFVTVTLSLCVPALIQAGDKLLIYTDGSSNDNHCSWALSLSFSTTTVPSLSWCRSRATPRTTAGWWASVCPRTLLTCSPHGGPSPPVSTSTSLTLC